MAEAEAEIGSQAMKLPPAYENDRFEMPWQMTHPSFCKVLKFLFWSEDKSNIPRLPEDIDKELPVHSLVHDEVKEPPADDKLRVTWLGHATVLLQFDGASVLTDPVFSDKVGPPYLRHLPGVPRRYRRCPCTVQELPDIDAVVISHSHYDHLDYSSVVDLNKRFGSRLTWFVPTGMRSWMIDSGCEKVEELSWWEDKTLNIRGQEIKFTCVPAVHWSNRGVADRNKILWAGWCVSGISKKFYFAGDTGYNNTLFKTIGQQYGPFDLAAIPIGAYEPRWMMECHHVNPDEAFQIHKDVKAFNSIGIHWGTFKLSNEYYMEPPAKIKELQDAESLEEGRLGFFTQNPGFSRLLSGWFRPQGRR